MSKAKAGFDRFVVFLIAAALIFLGVWSILYRMKNPYALELGEYRNSRIWLSATQARWFDPTLIAITIVGIIVGLWLILLNLRRRRIRVVRSESASNSDGSIRFSLPQIAGAVCDQLQDTPKVSSVKQLVAFDRGRRSMEFTVRAAADVNIGIIMGQFDQVERDIRSAIGDADVDTSYRLELEPVNREPELVRTVN